MHRASTNRRARVRSALASTAGYGVYTAATETEAAVDRTATRLARVVAGKKKSVACSLGIHVAVEVSPDGGWVLRVAGEVSAPGGVSPPRSLESLFSMLRVDVHAGTDGSGAVLDRVRWEGGSGDGESVFTLARRGGGGSLRLYVLTKRVVDEYLASDDLAAIAGKATATRGVFLRHVWDYVREHGLLMPGKKNSIRCDPTLTRLFGTEIVATKDLPSLIEAHCLSRLPIAFILNLNQSSQFARAVPHTLPLPLASLVTPDILNSNTVDVQNLTQKIGDTLSSVQDAEKKKAQYATLASNPLAGLAAFVKTESDATNALVATDPVNPAAYRTAAAFSKPWLAPLVYKTLNSNPTILPIDYSIQIARQREEAARARAQALAKAQAQAQAAAQAQAQAQAQAAAQAQARARALAQQQAAQAQAQAQARAQAQSIYHQQQQMILQHQQFLAQSRQQQQ